jgi:hypothetical protein
MDDVYSFVKEAEPIKKIDSHRRIIELMAQQTTECAYFIRDYAMNKSFCRLVSVLQRAIVHHCLCCEGERTLKNSFMSDVDNKIKQYEDKFKELKVAFNDRAILQTGIAVLQTGITVSRIFDNIEALGERPNLSRTSIFIYIY